MVFCRLFPFVLLACAGLPTPEVVWAEQEMGNIIGQVRILKGDFPPQPILISLEFRGSTIATAYADGQGRFGFYGLEPNLYRVQIKDEAYDAVDEQAIVNPVVSTTTFVMITLIPRRRTKLEPIPGRISGSNPDMVGLAEYTKQFPKPVAKEFEKGVKADQAGKKDEAIRRYQRAVEIAPAFYPAHNNLGSAYLSKSDFPEARKQFEEVIRLNQSDAAAYFNLSNVCILMNELPDAQHFLDEGMRRQPDSALGHFLRGSLNIRLGELTEAEGALRQAIQLDPLMVQPRLQLVNLLLREGRKEDAVAQLHDFVTAFPESSFNARAKELLKRLESPSTARQPVSK